MTTQEFRQLFDQYFDPVRNYIYFRSGDKELATDIAQDVFMKLWEKQVEYRAKENVGLLYKMAADEFISRYRRKVVEQRYLKKLELHFRDGSPEDQLQYEELKEKYEQALGELPEKQRVVFLMSRSEGLKYYEIAERLGISVKAVEKRMKKALGFLKANLKMS